MAESDEMKELLASYQKNTTTTTKIHTPLNNTNHGDEEDDIDVPSNYEMWPSIDEKYSIIQLLIRNVIQ